MTETDAILIALDFAGFDADDVDADAMARRIGDPGYDDNILWRVEITSDIVVDVDEKTETCEFFRR